MASYEAVVLAALAAHHGDPAHADEQQWQSCRKRDRCQAATDPQNRWVAVRCDVQQAEFAAIEAKDVRGFDCVRAFETADTIAVVTDCNAVIMFDDEITNHVQNRSEQEESRRRCSVADAWLAELQVAEKGVKTGDRAATCEQPVFDGCDVRAVERSEIQITFVGEGIVRVLASESVVVISPT